jgi:hypothetical protein
MNFSPNVARAPSEQIASTRSHETLMESSNSLNIAITSTASLFLPEVQSREILLSFHSDAHTEQKREVKPNLRHG